MTKIQGKSILVRVSARFELAMVRVIGSQLWLIMFRRGRLRKAFTFYKHIYKCCTTLGEENNCKDKFA